jgi:hypothetical protein
MDVFFDGRQNQDKFLSGCDTWAYTSGCFLEKLVTTSDLPFFFIINLPGSVDFIHCITLIVCKSMQGNTHKKLEYNCHRRLSINVLTLKRTELRERIQPFLQEWIDLNLNKNIWLYCFSILKMFLWWGIFISIPLLWRWKGIGTAKIYYSINIKNCVNKIRVLLLY